MAQRSTREMLGTGIAKRIMEGSSVDAAAVAQKLGRQPCLATIIVGNDPSSETYVRMKRNQCHRAGIESRHQAFPDTTDTDQLVDAISRLSQDESVDGILLQHPTPPHIDERAAFEAIEPGKDVDGVTMESFARMSFGLPGFVSCTPGGIMRLFQEYDVSLTGKNVVVVGRSPILGKPMAALMLAQDATVTVCHSKTVDLPRHLRAADVVVAAVGRPRFIHGGNLKEGVVVIDAGYNPGNIGDVDYPSAVRKASLITPVPGGVGPLTIAILIEQTVKSAMRRLAVYR